MAATRQRGKITSRPTAQSPASAEETPTEETAGDETSAVMAPASEDPQTPPSPQSDNNEELEKLGRSAVALFNKGNNVATIATKLHTSRAAVTEAFDYLGAVLPGRGPRPHDFVLTIPEERPARSAPAAQRPPRQSSSRPPVKARDKKPASLVTTADGNRVTVELPLEDLVRANRTAILRILLRDLEAQSS